MSLSSIFSFFFFNDTATTEIYTLSLHDALPILEKGIVLPSNLQGLYRCDFEGDRLDYEATMKLLKTFSQRSEEHTSELQSRLHLVCRLLLEKKKEKSTYVI